MAWAKDDLLLDQNGVDITSLSLDESLLLAASKFEREANIWDLESREKILSFSFENTVNDAVISPFGDYALVAAPNVYICRLDKPELGPIPTSLDSRASSLKIASDGRQAVIAANFNGIHVWDISSDSIIKSIKKKRTSYIGVAISPDQQSFAAIAQDDPTIYIWPIEGRPKPVQLKGHAQPPLALQFLEDNQTIVSFAENSEVVFWDIDSRSIRHRIPARTGFAASPDAALVAESQEWFVWIRDRKFDIVKEIRANGYVYDMILGRSGKTLYIASGIGEVTRWTFREPEDPDIGPLLNSGNWLDHAIRYFIQLGFFEEESNSRENEAIKSVASKFQDSYSNIESEIEKPSSLNLIRLIALDHNRVWWGDAECIYHDQSYTELLTEWSRISRGSFDPVNIAEVWSEDGGSIRLSFDFDGKSYTIKPEGSRDYLDARIVPQLNEIIAQTGFSFCVLDEPHDQTMVMLCLSQEENRRLEADLGLTFDNLKLIPE